MARFGGSGFLAALLGFGLGANLARNSYLTGPYVGIPFQPTQIIPSQDGLGVIVYDGPTRGYPVPYQNYDPSWSWLWGTSGYNNFVNGGLGLGFMGRRSLFGYGGRFRGGFGGRGGYVNIV